MMPTSPEQVRRAFRTPPAPTSPLPAEARAALAEILRDMRNVPRAIIGDPAEVVHYLGRQARRLQIVHDMRVRAEPAPAVVPRPASAVLMAPAGIASARVAAEAAFGPPVSKPAPPPRSTVPAARLVVNRRGRQVPIVLRRARAAGQLDLPL